MSSGSQKRPVCHEHSTRCCRICTLRCIRSGAQDLVTNTENPPRFPRKQEWYNTRSKTIKRSKELWVLLEPPLIDTDSSGRCRKVQILLPKPQTSISSLDKSFWSWNNRPEVLGAGSGCSQTVFLLVSRAEEEPGSRKHCLFCCQEI